MLGSFVTLIYWNFTENDQIEPSMFSIDIYCNFEDLFDVYNYHTLPRVQYIMSLLGSRGPSPTYNRISPTMDQGIQVGIRGAPPARRPGGY